MAFGVGAFSFMSTNSYTSRYTLSISWLFSWCTNLLMVFAWISPSVNILLAQIVQASRSSQRHQIAGFVSQRRRISRFPCLPTSRSQTTQPVSRRSSVCHREFPEDESKGQNQTWLVKTTGVCDSANYWSCFCRCTARIWIVLRNAA